MSYLSVRHVHANNQSQLIYRVSSKAWYNRSGDDYTCKNKLKKKNNIFSFEASFSREMSLKIRYSCINWKVRNLTLLTLYTNSLLNIIF